MLSIRKRFQQTHIMIKQIDHIGIAVKSLEATVPYYEKALGFSCEHVEVVEEQMVKVAFFNVNGVHIELLEPTSPESPIAKFIENKGEGIHHVAFASDNILGEISSIAASGVRLINETPKIGAHNKQIAFLHPKSSFGVLTEICQDSPGSCSCSH